MAEEETSHRHMLLEIYETRFGKILPPIRREDVKGFLRRRPIWLTTADPPTSAIASAAHPKGAMLPPRRARGASFDTSCNTR